MKKISIWAICGSLGLLAVSQASANLVINGDFEAGNTGFTSGYTYADPTQPSPISHNSNPMWDEGTYTVYNNINAVHQYWTYGPAGDHTSGHGNMLIVNGDTDKTVWTGQLTAALTPGTYTLSAWVANIYPDAPSTLRFSVGSTQVGADFHLGAPADGWKEFSATFTVPPVSGNPSVLDLVTLASGNDFAVDDISLSPVPEPATFIAGALLLLPFGASTLRGLRKKN